jgi:tRNA(Ile)-lysidine synthase
MQDCIEKNFKSNMGYAFLRESKRIAVAISGGVDSTSLLILAKEWASSLGIKIIALTVDHQLRMNSDLESEKVKNLCKQFNIEHHILKWEHGEIIASIEKKAREARYNLMTNFCLANGIECLLVGHTLDDRIENFFIRLSRGSGIHGLSSNNIMNFNNIIIFRPLHSFEKNELINFLSLKKIDYSIDESNLNPLFSQRNELRFKLESFLTSNFIEKSLYKRRIVKSLDLIDQSYLIIKSEFNNYLNNKVEISDFGFASLEINDILNSNSHVLYYIFSYLLTIIGGNLFTPKAYKVEKLIEQILLKKLTKISLHNCYIVFKNENIIIYKEYIKKNFRLKLENNLLIDNRFTVSIDEEINKNFYVSNFTEQDYRKIKGNLDLKTIINKNLKGVRDILFTFPLVEDLENNIIIPHINYMTSETKFSGKFIFSPKYVSKFIL